MSPSRRPVFRLSDRRIQRRKLISTPPYFPWSAEPGGVLWLDAMDPSTAQTSASVLDPDDLSSANWTKTGVSVTPDSSGTLDLLTATATTATTQQVPSNFSTGSLLWRVTGTLQRVADDWVCVELFASAGGRVWFNLNTGAVGTTGAFLTNATLTSLGGGRWSFGVSATAGGNYIMLRNAGADNTLTCTIGHSFLAGNIAIQQTRVSAMTNLVSSVAWPQATANSQPGYLIAGLNGRPCMDFRTQSNILSTEAAVVAALTNNGPYSLYFAGAQRATGAAAFFGGGAAGVANSRTRYWGVDGANHQRTFSQNDAAATVTTDDASTVDTSAHVHSFVSPGTTVDSWLDGAARIVAAAHDPGTLTPTRAAVGMRPDSSPDTGWDGTWGSVGFFAAAHTVAQRQRIEAYLKSRWGTP